MQTAKAKGGKGGEGSRGMSVDVVSEVPLYNTPSPLIRFLLTCVLASYRCLIINYKALHMTLLCMVVYGEHVFHVVGTLLPNAVKGENRQIIKGKGSRLEPLGTPEVTAEGAM